MSCPTRHRWWDPRENTDTIHLTVLESWTLQEIVFGQLPVTLTVTLRQLRNRGWYAEENPAAGQVFHTVAVA